MKLVFVSLVAALLIINTNAQFSPLLPGFGLGFPGMPFFPSFFGRVFQPYIPHLRPGLGMRGRLFIGKRDVENQTIAENNVTVHDEKNTIPVVVKQQNLTETVVEDEQDVITTTTVAPVVVVKHHTVDHKSNNRTVCNVSSSTNMLNCVGVENIECAVTPVFRDFENLKLRIFHLMPKPVEGDETSVGLWKVHHGKEVRNLTFTHPISHKNEMLFINSLETSTLPGFLVKNESCYERFLSFVKGVQHQDLKFTLSFN